MVTAIRESRGNRREAKGLTRDAERAGQGRRGRRSAGSGLAERTYDNMQPGGQQPLTNQDPGRVTPAREFEHQ